GNPGIAGAVAPYESARVGQNLAAGGRVKAAAIGVGDARIGLERGSLRAMGPFDALRPGQRVNVVEVEVQVVLKGPEFSGFGETDERIRFREPGQRHRAVHKLENSVRSEVAGIG